MGVAKGPGPWAGVLLSDEETIQIIAVLADVLDGHDARCGQRRLVTAQ
jgi:hypothetical protein